MLYFVLQSLCLLLCSLCVSSVDVPSEKLACITLTKYTESDCNGTEIGTEKYTTYTEAGHSECKVSTDEKTGMTLFTTNNEYCDLAGMDPQLHQTWYLFDQQKDCTPFLELQIFQLEQVFSAGSCILGGKIKFISCVAGACDNETLPDYTTGIDTTGNVTGGFPAAGNVTGNVTTEGGSPPAPDTSFGKIKDLCSEKYIKKHNDSDCTMICEPGACCFDDVESCSNSTEACALYEGCQSYFLNGTNSSGNITGNVTGGAAGNVTGNVTTEGGSPPAPDTSFGKIKDLCSEKYIQKHNDSDCLIICEPGACCFDDVESCSNSTEACALYEGCQSYFLNGTNSSGNITGNVTDGGTSFQQNATENDLNGTTIGVLNSTESNSTLIMGNETIDSGLNGTASVDLSLTDNTTASEIGNETSVTHLNATSPGHIGNATTAGGNGTNSSAGAAVSGEDAAMETSDNSRPPKPDDSRGGPAVVCSAEFRKEHKNGICRKTCLPGACCFDATDSCASNTEICALYALCKPVLKAGSRV
jgi:hypothetical protein